MKKSAALMFAVVFLTSAVVVSPAWAKPAAPRGLVALTTSTTQVRLSWNAVSGATSYQVWRSSGTSSTFRRIVTVTSRHYANKGLKALTRYNYKVRAMKKKVAGKFSRVSSAFTVIPGGLSATAKSTSEIDVSWSPVAGATSYQLWRSKGTAGTFTLIATVSARTYADKGLATATKYRYKLRVALGPALTGYSAIQAAATLSSGAPAAPTGVTASKVSASQIKVSWKAVATATAYKVYRSLNSGAFAYRATVSAPTLSYNDSGLAAGSYRYKVSAVKGSTEGAQSAATTTITLTPSPPAAPTGVTASNTSATQIKVSWKAVATATAYKVYRSVNSGAFAHRATVSAPTLSYNDSGLAAGSYRYKVSAVAGSTEGPQSAATTTITLTTPLPAPGNFKATTYNYQSVEVSWDAVQNAATYRIYYATVASSNIADYLHLDYAGTDCRVIGLDAGKTYYFRVAAVDAGGQAGTPTGFLAATTSAPPGNPPQPQFYLYSIDSAGSNYRMNFYRATSPIYPSGLDPTFDFFTGSSSGGMVYDSTADLSQYFYYDITPGKSWWYGFTANYGPYASTRQLIHVAALGQPASVSADGLDCGGAVHMSWSAVPYAARYNIYYCTGWGALPGESWFDFKADGEEFHPPLLRRYHRHQRRLDRCSSGVCRTTSS